MILLLLSLLFALFSCTSSPEIKEGDMIFQCSQSQQSPYIQQATGSTYTHCGIIIEEPYGLYVLEASNVVKLTPYDEWIKKGSSDDIKIVRAFEEPINIEYQQYLGKKYDLAFKFDNDKYYCSELLYDIYLEQFDYQLAVPKKVNEYNIIGLDAILAKRGIDKDQLVVAPSDILKSDKVFEL